MDYLDKDIKIYKKYDPEDIKKYIDLYLKEKKMGINFDPLFLLAQIDLDKKKWLISESHKGTQFPFNVNEFIDDYSMHLLTLFFILNSSNDMFSYVEKNFIKEYVRNESELEGVNDLSLHGREEMMGLESMYRYINSGENEYTTGSIILTDLHEKLFSYTDGKDTARAYRTDVRFLPDSGIELEDPYYIVSSMRKSDRVFDELYAEAEKIADSEIEDRMHMINPFLTSLMKYSAELVRIHPFPDGNGRSIRGLINFLLEKAGLPPVYLKASERNKYQQEMNKAIVNGEYAPLTNFYKNKLCDSIEELIIDPFVYAIDEYVRQQRELEAKRQKGSNVIRLFEQQDEQMEDNNNKTL